MKWLEQDQLHNFCIGHDILCPMVGYICIYCKFAVH